MRTILETVATEAASRLIEKFRGTARVTNPTDKFSEVVYQTNVDCTYSEIIEAAMLYVDVDVVRIDSAYYAGTVIIRFFKKY